MSYYPAFNTKSNVFNSQDIWSAEESTAGGTTVSLDLSSFVQKNSAVFTDQIYMQAGVEMNMNGSIFNQEKITDIADTKSLTIDHTTRLDGIDVASVIQNGRLDVIESNFVILDALQDIDLVNIPLIQTDISAIQTLDAAQDVRLDSIETLNIAQNVRLDSIETLNIAQNVRLDSIEILDIAQDVRLDSIEILDTAQDVRLDSVESFNTAQDVRLDSVETLNTAQDVRLDAIEILDTVQDVRLDSIEIIDTAQDVRLDAIEILDTAQDVRLDAIEILDTAQDVRLDAIESNLNILDGLQDSDLANIPVIQSDILTLQTNASALASTVTSNQTSNIDSISSLNTLISNVTSSSATNATSVTALVNSDILHDTQIAALTSKDLLLQTNIDLKQNLISLSSQLDTSLIFDIGENDSLDNIISLLDANLEFLQNDKQDNINSVSKLNSSYLDLTTTPLQYVDITAPLQSQITSIINAVNTLQNLTSNDTISTFQDIEDNFDSLDANKLDVSVYDDTISPQITSILSSISTLQGLQNGDITSFDNINTTLTTLQTDVDSKQAQITSGAKLDSSLLNRDDSLQHVDVTSSISNSLTALQTDVDSKQSQITSGAKLDSSLLNRNDSLQYVDVTSSLSASLNTINTSISNLNAYDVAQTTWNSSQTDQINTHSTNISTLAAFNTAQTTINSTLQSNIDAKGSKTELHSTLSYDPATNIISHTYDENNLFVNTLDDTALMELQLTIGNVSNNKSYNQRVIIDAIEHKSYINVLKINDEVVEIKHRDGDAAINLAPIAGYSMLEQHLTISRINDSWYVQSSLELFYNSNSNVVFDNTPPIIILTGSANISHEINTTYTEPGFSAEDQPGSIDMTSDVVVGGDTVDTTVLGAAYNITYNVVDAKGNNAIQKIRTINIVDTTNPVITLGTAEINLNTGDTYDSTSAGASASDNSGETTLTITVDESNLNMAAEGAYTVTFSTSDSTGNSHSINQIVNVSSPAMTLKYDNASQDIFQLLNFTSKIAGQSHSTKTNWTESSGDLWKQGDYQVRVTSYRGDNSIPYYDSLFSGLTYAQQSKYFEHRLHSHPWVDNTYGTVTGTTNGWRNSGMNFTPYNISNGGINFTTPGCQTGEYVEVSMPFHVKPSKFTISGSLIIAHRFQIAASLDGVNWGSLGYIHTGSVPGSYDLNLNLASDFTGYNKFRVILYQNGSNYRAFYDNFKMYGKVYTF